MTDILTTLRHHYALDGTEREHPIRRAVAEIERLRAEAAQQRCPYVRSSGEGTHWCALAAKPVDHREAMRLALAELQVAIARHADWGDSLHTGIYNAVDALRAALGDTKKC